MRSDSIYASLLAKVSIRSQVSSMLDDLKQKYQQLISNQGFLKFNKWAKLQTCHHCGNKGHVIPNCQKYLAEKANGTLPPPGKKCLTRPALVFNNIVVRKCRRIPNSMALLSAFSAFTTKHLADSQPATSETTANGDDHNIKSTLFWCWWDF